MDLSSVSWNGEKVVLRTNSQWQPWYAALRRYAKTLDVWEYCNPEIARADHPEPPREPAMPEPPQFDPGEATGAALRALKEEFKEEKAAWRDDMEIYKLSLAKQQRIRKGMQLVDQALLVSVDIKLHQLMDRLDAPYDRLRFLMRRFSHTQSHKMEVMVRWREQHMKGPKRGQNVLQWLDEWDLLREEVLSLGIEPDNLHPALFLQAIKDVMPVWWDTRFQQIVIQGQPTSMSTLLDSFRTTYVETRKARGGVSETSSSSSKPAFATSTWQGYKEAKPVKNGKFVPFQERQRCPCGGRGHPAIKCWTLNEAIRPVGWEPYQARLDAVSEAFDKEPAWKTWIEAKIGENSSSESSTEKTANHTTHQVAYATALSIYEDHHQTQWILDSGASVHVCNDRSMFTEYRDSISSLKTGDSKTPTIGIGTVVMDGVNPVTRMTCKVTLSECQYAPTFPCNLVSLGRLEKKGSWWDMRKGHIIRNGEAVLEVYRERDIYVFSKPEMKLSGPTPHVRLGHVYQGAIQQLPELVNGVKIASGEERPDGPDNKMTMGYNQHCWITHFYVEGIRFHWSMTHTSKNGCQEAIQSFIAFAIKWLQLPIKVWHSDNEKTVDDRIHKLLDDMGFIHTFTVPYSLEMNGPGERSGGVLTLRARALIKEGKLPDKLWPEAVAAAVYLLNRTPTRLENGSWIVPWEEARRFGLNEQVTDTELTDEALGLSPTAGGADDAQDPAKDVLDTSPPTNGDSPEQDEIQDLNRTNIEEKAPYGQENTTWTPPRSLGADSAADQGVGIEEEENEGYSGDLTLETPVSMLEGSSPARTDPDEAVDEVEDVDRAALDIGNIVNGPRVRRQRRDEDFAYKTTTSADGDTTRSQLVYSHLSPRTGNIETIFHHHQTDSETSGSTR
ncbi:uncharacterized protein N7484_006763 [Penicillium longicatenatum]|uniref:uncharacterized protein n=1 Tax=Penicillium longicatenatum TaxID=1561947 RepID=UPI0025480872|nr:uncharacterized protein N7484_006763 [Penicillium longicatenatum]KAJ5644256.1 hypothetical protein N7484_006763 [Penicillium longicatenatum]